MLEGRKQTKGCQGIACHDFPRIHEFIAEVIDDLFVDVTDMSLDLRRKNSGRSRPFGIVMQTCVGRPNLDERTSRGIACTVSLE